MYLSKKKSHLLVTALLAAVLVGCGGGSKAPISSVDRGSSGVTTGPGTYTVQRGDTMYAIARKFNVPVSQILSLNNITDPSQIKVGQRLRIRAGGANAVSSGGARVAGAAISSGSSAMAADARVIAWDWPVRGSLVSGFSESTRGIDIAAPIGTPVKAAADGVVSYAGNGLRGLGNLILISHSNNFISAYAHNSELLVAKGKRVKKGDTIAKVGQSDTTSPRLHFEIRRQGKAVNPQGYLPR